MVQSGRHPHRRGHRGDSACAVCCHLLPSHCCFLSCMAIPFTCMLFFFMCKTVYSVRRSTKLNHSRTCTAHTRRHTHAYARTHTLINLSIYSLLSCMRLSVYNYSLFHIHSSMFHTSFFAFRFLSNTLSHYFSFIFFLPFSPSCFLPSISYRWCSFIHFSLSFSSSLSFSFSHSPTFMVSISFCSFLLSLPSFHSSSHSLFLLRFLSFPSILSLPLVFALSNSSFILPWRFMIPKQRPLL